MGVAPSSRGRSAALRAEPAAQSQAKPAAANAERLVEMLWAYGNIPGSQMRELFPEYPSDEIRLSDSPLLAAMNFFVSYAEDVRASLPDPPESGQ